MKLTSKKILKGDLKMKQLIVTSLIVMMIAGATFANPEGIPKGYKMIGHLNIIAAPKDKNPNMDGNGGGVIFVDPEGKSKIYLVQSGTEDAPGTEENDFVVLDKNATDNDGALLAIPDPGLDPYLVGGDMTNPDGSPVDYMSDYSVFVRPRGKPGGWATITTCAELYDATGGELFDMLNKTEQKTILNRTDGDAYCSVEQVGRDVTLREKGKSTFTNVTAELLTIVFAIWVDLDDDDERDEGEIFFVRVPIFDPLLQGEYWEYEQGWDEDAQEWCTLKNLEVRFYAYQTDVRAGDPDLEAPPEPE
jgi:hypothetical protein